MTKQDVKAILEAAKTPLVKSSEIWMNQISNEEEEDSISLPAVYLSFNTQYGAASKASQSGMSQVVLRVVQKVYQEPGVGEGNFEAYLDEVFDLPQDVIQRVEATGATLTNDQLDEGFRHVVMQILTFDVSVTRSRILTTVKQPADLNTEGDILPN